jgi:ADP-heptose:LPS heptosyltransferase
MADQDRVLVVRRGGLGDTLLLAPLLRALRRARPNVHLHLAGTREHCDVLCAYGLVDVAMSAEDLWLWLPDRARGLLAAFDLVVGDEVEVAHRPLYVTRVEDGVPFGLQLARQAGLEPRWPQDAQLLPAPRAARETSAPGPRALAPGSGGEHKRWPKQRWLELCGRLQRAGHQVLVVVGPVERERDDPRSWPWPGEVEFVVEETPRALGARLERVGRLYGNDSGVTHLAAALGRPTTAVFVATDPRVWAPVGAHVRVVGGVGAAPTVDEVFVGPPGEGQPDEGQPDEGQPGEG